MSFQYYQMDTVFLPPLLILLQKHGDEMHSQSYVNQKIRNRTGRSSKAVELDIFFQNLDIHDRDKKKKEGGRQSSSWTHL